MVHSSLVPNFGWFCWFFDSFLVTHVLRRPFNSFHNVLVTGTPAQVAFQAAANFFLARVWIAAQQLVRRQDHPRRAKPALQAVLFPETFLEGM